MLNYIWCGIMLFSLIVGILTGRIEQTVAGAFGGAKSAVETVFAIAGVMCLWSGFMRIAERSHLTDAFGRLLSIPFHLLFPEIKINSPAANAIIMNIIANLLGMSNASTPLGLKAMRELDVLNGKRKYASNSMCMFVVLNTASIQLIPSTLIALRSAAGSASPASIIAPIWITSFCALLTGIILIKLLCGKE